MTRRKMNEVTIKIVAPAEAELLSSLGRETFHDAFADHPLMPAEDLKIYLDEAFSVARVADELADPQSIFMLAELGGEAAGYAKLERAATAPGATAKNPIKLKRLYVKQKFLGCGVGASLMKRCLDEAVKLKHDKIWLTVWEHNPSAQNFYRRWNFEPCGTIDFLLGKTLLTDIFMQRSVQSIKIVTPSSEEELAIGRELGYQYAESITRDPVIRRYFMSQHFLADIEKMPEGFEPPDGAFLLAFVQDEPAGIVALRRLEDGICEMKRLFVSPKFQGIGLGRILAEAIIDEGKRLGYGKMRLDSSRLVMAKAIELYKSMGFYEIESYNQNFVPDAVFMEKIL